MSSAELIACAKFAKEVAEKMQKLEAQAQSGLKKYFKQRSADDVAVLVTMLERCAASSNANLHVDFAKHKIPERVKRINSMVTGIHYHDWFTRPGPSEQLLGVCRTTGQVEYCSGLGTIWDWHSNGSVHTWNRLGHLCVQVVPARGACQRDGGGSQVPGRRD